MNRAAFAAVCVAALTAIAAAMPSAAAAATASVTDDTAADFAAGTPGTATQVVAPGSVQLARAREDFDGDALPPGFSSAPWSSDGAATVAGGGLTADGSLVAAGAFAGAPRSLELRATFGATTFENIGYGTDFNDGPCATFSTGGGSLPYGLFVRVSPAQGAASTDVAIPDVDPALPHTYRIGWAADAVSFYVDGVLVDSEPTAIAADMRPLISDFAADGTGVTVDWLTGDAYAASGAFLSRVLDAGDTRAAWGALTAQADAGVSFTTRSGDTATPDASWSDFETLGPAGQIRSPRGRYLQYRATLTTADGQVTPSLDRVDASFDVDTVAPVASVDGIDVTGATAAAFFSSPDTDVARFECKLDDGDYAACVSGEQFTTLADGAHTVAVRAIDTSGNTGAAATRAFTVDTTAPATSISGLDVAGTSATVRFSSAAPDLARFECKLDAGPYVACTGPQRYTGLADGAHTLAVRALDAAGNVGVAAVRGFVVDATAPRVSIGGVTVTGSAATVRFASPDGDVARFECRLDSGAFSVCGSPQGYAGLAPGAHTVAVRAVDTHGNVGAAASRGFSVAAPSSPAEPPVVSRAPVVRLTTTRTRASHSGVVTLTSPARPARRPASSPFGFSVAPGGSRNGRSRWPRARRVPCGCGSRGPTGGCSPVHAA